MRQWLPFSFVLFAVLGITVLVAGFPASERSASDPLIEQAQAMTLDEARSPELDDLDQRLSEIGGSFAGHVGIAITDVEAAQTVHFNGLELFPQQSVTKLWVTMAALDTVDAGELFLDERARISRDELTVFYQPLRSTVLRSGRFVSDYGDLIDRAITQSDNTANDKILRRIGGPEAVDNFLEENDLASIRFGTDERTKQSLIAGLQWRQAYSVGPAFFDARDKVPEATRREAFESYLADPIDGAAPAAMSMALARLVRGELLSEQSTALLLSSMQRTKSGPRRLKGAVPPGWEFGHKTGTGQFFDGEQSGYNDVGILTAPDGSHYTLAVMIARTRAPTPVRMEMMQEVTRAAIAYYEAKLAAE